MATPKFDGVPLSLGGQRLLVPALSLRLVRKYQPLLAKVPEFATREPTEQETDEMVEMIGAAIERNHADITTDWLLDHLDLGNLPAVLQVIVGQSGMTKVTPGEFAQGALSTGTT